MLTSALYTGLTGMTAASRGIEVTSNNVANALTPGYTAKSLVFSDLQSGGVKIQGPTDNRNLGLYSLIDQTTSQLQFSDALSGITDIMDPSVGVGDGSVYSKLQNLQDAFLKINDSSLNLSSVQSLLLTSSTELVNTLHRTYQTLSSQSQGIVTHTQALVSDANAVVSDIASTDKQISNTIDPSAKSQLLDNRQAKIDELSAILDISVSYNSNNMVSISTGNKLLLAEGNKNLLLNPAGITGGKIGANNLAINKIIPDQLAALDTEAADTATRVNNLLGQPLFSIPTGSNAGFASNISVLVTDASTINTKFNTSIMSSIIDDISEDVTVNYAVFGAFKNSLTSSKEATTTQLSGLSSYRQNIEGVSLENEAINLMRFKTAYEANVKMVSVVSDMMQTTFDMFG